MERTMIAHVGNGVLVFDGYSDIGASDAQTLIAI